jgi:hypothetical protein
MAGPDAGNQEGPMSHCNRCGGSGQGYTWDGRRNVPCKACNPDRRLPDIDTTPAPNIIPVAVWQARMRKR